MPFYAAVNLTEQSVSESVPWDFQGEDPGAQVRLDKESRQQWYKNVSTKWNFYTGIEGANPNQRVSKDNPPLYFHGVSADYDLRVPDARINEVIESMPIKPTYVERSLGGNERLVFEFEQKLPIDTMDFAIFVLEELKKFLSLDLMPGLDEGAFVDPNRLYCNGASWRATGFGKIKSAQLQTFFVKCGKKFRFTPNEINIPIDIVAKEMEKKFPNMGWPGEFAIGSQGPSFWIEGSTSPLSAIVKQDGMFTFSAHASKPFHTWTDILGPEFTREYKENSVELATANIYYDDHKYHRMIAGEYHPCDATEMSNHFRVTCGLSSKPGKDNLSMIDIALNHIYNHNRIVGAAPFVLRPPGPLIYMGKRYLNTFKNNVKKPAAGSSPWGPHGNHPFLSLWLSEFFNPSGQLPYWLAWAQYFYNTALEQHPLPGQAIFLPGGVGVGKTLLNRHVIGWLVGGFADASGYLARGADFNSQLVQHPLWCVDDETINETTMSHATFQAMIKKIAANQEIMHNRKYEVACMVEWIGRIICTLNNDFVSSRTLGPLDNNSLDKISIFRCQPDVKNFSFKMPTHKEMRKILDRELPSFARALVDYKVPDFVEADPRFGWRSYHEPTLLNQAQQSGRSAPFKELLTEALEKWFADHKDATEYRGTVLQITRLITGDPRNEVIIRTLRLEQTVRHLEMMQRLGVMDCRADSLQDGTRIWVFQRPPDTSSQPMTPPESPL